VASRVPVCIPVQNKGGAETPEGAVIGGRSSPGFGLMAGYRLGGHPSIGHPSKRTSRIGPVPLTAQAATRPRLSLPPHATTLVEKETSCEFHLGATVQCNRRMLTCKEKFLFLFFLPFHV
jgi:hypothetical protein